MRDMFSETQFEPRKSHLKWQKSVVESQGSGPNGQKPASYPREGNGKHDSSTTDRGNGYEYDGSHHKFGHDKPHGRGSGDFDAKTGTIFLGKYKPPDKARKYRIPKYTEMTAKQMKIAGKVLDERFDVRSLLV